MKKILLVSLALALFSGILSSCSKSSDDNSTPVTIKGTWTTKAPRLSASSDFAAVTMLDSLILTMGGYMTNAYNTSMELYNPSNDTWLMGSQMPAGTRGFGAAIIGYKVYVLGGNAPVYSSWDILQAKWTAIAASPNYHLDFGQPAVVNGKIYLFGGLKADNNSTNMVEVYDPATDIYDLKASMPSSRHNAAVAVVNNKVYVIGGATQSLSEKVIRNNVEMYDPASDAWAIKTAMPTARESACAEVINGKIYVIGGLKDGLLPSNVVEVYDPSTNSWSTSYKSMTTAHGAFVTGKVRNKIYAIGGVIDVAKTATNVTEEFTP